MLESWAVGFPASHAAGENTGPGFQIYVSFRESRDGLRLSGIFGLYDLRKQSLSDVEKKKSIYLPEEIKNHPWLF